jgi:hypothetical protein
MREAVARGDFGAFRARFLARYGVESVGGSADIPADSEASSS